MARLSRALQQILSISGCCPNAALRRGFSVPAAQQPLEQLHAQIQALRSLMPLSPELPLEEDAVNPSDGVMAGLRVDFSMLLEPLGFVKVLEWIFAIFALATCGGFQGETTLLVSCKGVVNKTVTAAFSYPFRLNAVEFSAPDPKGCDGTWTDVYLVGNFSSSAQFFVTLGALVFLYCIAALVVYIGYNHVYQQNNKFPLTDLAISVLTTLLWLVSTSVWAKALVDIKMSTGANIIPGIEACKASGTTCNFVSVTSMGILNLSVVFGLLNAALWGGNVWLIYKDTKLHNQWNRISESPTERET